MKFLQVIDTAGHTNNINVDFIYNLTSFLNENENKYITVIHLKYQGDENAFGTIKTYDALNLVQSRLGNL